MTDSGQIRDTALAVERLSVDYGSSAAVRDVSFSLERGETLALVGESGSGKSTVGFALMGLLPPTARVTHEAVQLDGHDVDVTDESAMRELRGRSMAMVFQDPLTALNPVLTIGRQLAEIFVHHEGLTRREARDRAVEMLERVRIPDPRRRARQYPQQMSGGMRQRIVIAMALALSPKLIIADEPTTALDVTVQAHVMSLLDELAKQEGASTLLITHDLAVVASHAKRVVVLYAGQIMETGDIRSIYERPAHPYTLGLLNAIPRLSQGGERLRPIPGIPPGSADAVPGCPFHPRCPVAVERCRVEAPQPRPIGLDRSVSCHRAEEVIDGELDLRASA